MFESTETKPGEIIRVGIQQVDANGEQISLTVHEINGLTNETANLINFGILDKLEELLKSYGEVKNNQAAANRTTQQVVGRQ